MKMVRIPRAEELKAPNTGENQPWILEEYLSNITPEAEQKLLKQTAKRAMERNPWLTEEEARRLYGVNDDTPLI